MRWTMFILAITAPAWPCHSSAAETSDSTHYRSIDSFLDSVPGVVKDQVKGAYGDLTGSGRRDWAGLVSINASGVQLREHDQRIVILTQTADGEYFVAARSALVGLLVDDVAIRKASVFVKTEEYQGGEGVDRYFQFKVRAGQWRLIGARFHLYCRQDSEDGTIGTSASDLDWNLVTGAATVRHLTYEREVSEQRINIRTELPLLDGVTINQELAWPKQFDQYPPC